jgi:multisubunit Na+/H+ antiporter MnhG subunit
MFNKALVTRILPALFAVIAVASPCSLSMLANASHLTNLRNNGDVANTISM